jgi:uncharacterized surface protein with fasciclin (FAS1) repeats
MKLILASVAALALISPAAMAGECPSKAANKDAQLTKYEQPKRDVTAEKTKADIVDTAAAAGSFKTLIAAAKAAGLVDALKSEGPIPIFAPTDAAFAALPAGTVDNLLKPENKQQLADILKLHVIAGKKVTSADLKGKTLKAATLNGEVDIDGTKGVKVEGANVITADVMASNGIIHVIDKVLLPES